MVVAKEGDSGITQMIVFFLVIAMLWLFTVTPFGDTKEQALWNVVVVASVGIFFFSEKLKEFTVIKDTKTFFELFSAGAILGILVSYIVSIIVGSTGFLWNLLGSISASKVAELTLEQSFWTILIQPLSETILYVPILLFLVSFLKSRTGSFSKPLALFFASIIFASLHFLAFGSGDFERSLSGFIEFIGSPNGAFPQLLLGVGWGILILGFKNWVIGFGAHFSNNLFYIYGLLSDPTLVIAEDVRAFILIATVSTALIVIITFFFTRLRIINNFSIKEVIV